MISYQFKQELEGKKLAEEYFRDFIRPDYTIVSAKTKEELGDRFNDYSRLYSTMFGEQSDVHRYPIQKAYEYLLTQKEKAEDTTFEHYDIEGLYKAYERVMFLIGQYEFRPRHMYSTGDTQNKANKNMLLELSMFRSFVIGVLKKIDKTVPSDESDEITDFHVSLLNYVEDFTTRLNQTYDNLNEKEEMYHTVWTQAVEPPFLATRASMKELGSAKKEWRVAKNEACHELLMVCKDLNLINTIINRRQSNIPFDLGDDEFTERFSEGIENIKSGPNYYSYLCTPCKKQEIKSKTYQKKARKEQNKNISAS